MCAPQDLKALTLRGQQAEEGSLDCSTASTPSAAGSLPTRHSFAPQAEGLKGGSAPSQPSPPAFCSCHFWPPISPPLEESETCWKHIPDWHHSATPCPTCHIVSEFTSSCILLLSKRCAVSCLPPSSGFVSVLGVVPCASPYSKPHSATWVLSLLYSFT